MKYIKSINEYSSPITLNKDEVGMGIKQGDTLVIKPNYARAGAEKWYFNRLEGNMIWCDPAEGPFDEEMSFNLDELGTEWFLLSINGQEIIIEESKKN